MQTYLLSGLGSPTSSFNLFLPLPRPRVSNHYHSSVHYHYHNNQSKLTLHHHYHRPRPTPGWGRNGGSIFASSSSAAAGAATNRDHQIPYAILGISVTASSAEIKRTYRLLAKKYHPDVCKESKSREVFMSIRHAYDVLSKSISKTPTRALFPHFSILWGEILLFHVQQLLHSVSISPFPYFFHH